MIRATCIASLLALAVGCSGSPPSPRGAAAWPANAMGCEPAVLSVEDTVAEVLRLVNSHRSDRGMNRLTLDPRISELAQSHSNRIAQRDGDLSHEGAHDRYMAIASFLPAKKFAENISQACGDARHASAGAFALWLKSSSHKENMEGAFTHTGIGVAQGVSGRAYFTQLFSGP